MRKKHELDACMRQKLAFINGRFSIKTGRRMYVMNQKLARPPRIVAAEHCERLTCVPAASGRCRDLSFIAFVMNLI